MWLVIDFPFHDSSIVKQETSKYANKEASVVDALNRDIKAEMEEKTNCTVKRFRNDKTVPVSTRCVAIDTATYICIIRIFHNSMTRV